MARIDIFDVPQGDTRNVEVDYSAAASSFGVSASSVVWTVDDGSSVTISGTPSIITNISTGTIVAGANKTGCSLIKAKATMTDSQTITAFFKINVIDPAC